jgi:PST family polysaccharide transporter
MLGGNTGRNFSVYLLHHVARYLLPLVMTPFLARMLGPAQFGDFVVWNACVWTSSLLMEFGFYLYAVNRAAAVKDDADLQATVSAIMTAKLILMPAAMAAYAIMTIGLGIASRQPLVALLGSLAVLSYGGSVAWYFQSRQRGITAVLVEAVPQALQLMLILCFVRAPSDLWMAALFQTLAAVLTLGTSLAILRRDTTLSRARAIDAVKTISEASPFFLERCSYAIYATATPIAISLLSTHQQAAFYGVGEKIGAFLIGFSIPLTQTMLPVIARRLNLEAGDWALSLRLLAIATAFTGLMAVLVFLTIEPVVIWFFGESYRPAVAVSHWFCVSSVLMAYQLSLANFVVIPGGMARVLGMASAAAMAVSLTIQGLLVADLGAVGSVMARAMAELSMGVVLTVVACRLVRRGGRGGLTAKLVKVAG